MKYVFCVLMLLSSLAQAFEFLPEAAEKTGYGPTQEGWSLYYSGVCGERVAVQVNYSGRSELKTILPRVHAYARKSATHIVKRCPSVTDIRAEARGGPTRPAPTYLFSMRRAADWAPADKAWYADLVAERTGNGYLPFELHNYVHGLLQLKDGVFEGHYGRTLGNYMRGEQIKQHMMEGTEPPRISHFTISGDWYEFGDNRQNKRCSSSKDGYPYWGSFVFTFGPRAEYGNFQKKACAAQEEKGQAERLYLSNAKSRDFKREWGVEKVKAVTVLGERLAAMGLQSKTHDRQAYVKTRKPIFENAQIKIFPRRENWCSRLELDAVYAVASEERNSAFEGDYVKFLGSVLWDLVNDHCGKPLVVGIDNYQEGDTERWDRMSFLLDRPNKSGFEPKDEKYVELTDYTQSERAEAYFADVDARYLGPPCKDSHFCELTGGVYLNAIYLGDVATVKRIDQQHAAEMEGFLDKSAANLGMQADNPINNLFKSAIASSAFIEDVTNKYMYSYAAWGRQCLKPGAQEKVFRHTTPVVVETDPWGGTTTSGGDVYEASYTTNPEFFALRDRLGSHSGAQNSTSPFIRKTKKLVYTGMVAMKKSYQCHSPEVQQFEHNLRQIVLAQLNGEHPINLQTTALATTLASEPQPKVKNEKPDLPTSAVPKQVAESVSRAAKPASPAAVTEPEPIASTAHPSTPTAAPEPALTQAEIYAKRNAEIKALNDKFIAQINALNAKFASDNSAATTNDERLEIMRAFQAEVAVLRTEVESKTQEIESRYK